MNNSIIDSVLDKMRNYLSEEQYIMLEKVMVEEICVMHEVDRNENYKFLSTFLDSKKVEGCSNRMLIGTLYEALIIKLNKLINKHKNSLVKLFKVSRLFI